MEQKNNKMASENKGTSTSTSLSSSATASPYQLVSASKAEIEEVVKYYHIAPVPGYTIRKVEVVMNPTLQERFDAQLKLLKERQGNPTFQSKWSNEPGDAPEESHWRQSIHTQLQCWTKPYQDARYSVLHLLPLWHGTKKNILDSLFRTGYATLALEDPGFFGRGIYSTREPAYAYRVYSDGTLIVNKVAFFSAYPVIQGDMEKLQGKSNYQNYDAHWIPVVPENPKYTHEKNYFPTHPHQPAAFHECVVFESAQCMPRYLITLQADLLISPQLSLSPEGRAYYQQGHQHEWEGNIQQAFTCFIKSAEFKYPPAYLRVVDCAWSWGLTTPSDEYMNQAQQHLSWLKEQSLMPLDQDIQAKAVAQYTLGRCYELECGVEKLPEKAIQLYQAAIQSANDGLAYYRLGWCYEKGIGVEKDEAQAVKHYQVCAQRGYAPSLVQLGYCYQEGIGIEPSIGLAFAAYQQGAAKGHAGAQTQLASFFEKGKLVQQNMNEAIRYYQKAAAQGQLTAQMILGELYAEGRGIIRDVEQAKYYYRLAAQQASSLAKAQLEELLEESQGTQSLFQPAPVSSQAEEKIKEDKVCILQ